MSRKDPGHRADTDESLRSERHNVDRTLAQRVAVAEEDADHVLRIARERADRLLQAARTTADARLPLSEQTIAAVALLLEQRDEEDREIGSQRARADALLDDERLAARHKLAAQLVLERQTTDLHLALERHAADGAVASRDDFLAQTSHDLRGFMAAQHIYLSLLAKETTQDARSQLPAHVAALVKIEAQMDRLIGDLVDIVAIEANKLTVARRAHSAFELVSTAAAVFEPLAREREQSLSIMPAPSDVKIHVDLARGVQVLGNLLSNAIKFTPRSGKITVGFETAPDEVTFFVADTGPGVSPERAEHIFERFVRSSSGSAGLGLGLFIAAHLVEAHGGRLWLDREHTGGSLFRFTLLRA
ncbi:MAG TPA: sensor histidine kinase [Polyangiaceae bacterium]|nr:sensor histidine kinase [Polyangiaceae bacterium]